MIDGIAMFAFLPMQITAKNSGTSSAKYSVYGSHFISVQFIDLYTRIRICMAVCGYICRVFICFIMITTHMGTFFAAYFTTVQLKRVTYVINLGLPIGGMLGEPV